VPRQGVASNGLRGAIQRVKQNCTGQITQRTHNIEFDIGQGWRSDRLGVGRVDHDSHGIAMVSGEDGKDTVRRGILLQGPRLANGKGAHGH
jgi:hypothetical protein